MSGNVHIALIPLVVLAGLGFVIHDSDIPQAHNISYVLYAAAVLLSVNIRVSFKKKRY